MGDERVCAQLVGDAPDYADYRLSERKLRDYAEVVELAHGREVQAIPLSPPISASVIEMIRISGKWPIFQRWKFELLAGGRYWDFSCYNDIALSPVLFKYEMHFKPAFGFELLCRMLETDTRTCPAQMCMIDEAGFRVDRDPICDVLIAQQERMRAAVERETVFTEAAKKAVLARILA
jgi:hypothetical protein